MVMLRGWCVVKRANFYSVLFSRFSPYTLVMPAVTNKLATLPTKALSPIRSVCIVLLFMTSHISTNATQSNNTHPIRVTATRKNALLLCPLFTRISSVIYLVNLIDLLFRVITACTHKLRRLAIWTAKHRTLLTLRILLLNHQFCHFFFQSCKFIALLIQLHI